MRRKNKLNRREFLKISALALGGLALSGGNSERVLAFGRNLQSDEPLQPEFPVNTPLVRMGVNGPGANVPIKSEPNINAPTVGRAYFDDVFEWKQEVIANQVDQNRINQRWFEIPEGFVYADEMQKVWHIPQDPLDQLPETPDGSHGMWVEIYTPYMNLNLTKPQSNYQYWIRETIRPRIYYSQVFWAFDVRQHPETGRTQYCLMQKYGAFPSDTYWVDASACRQITPEEVSPIHPGAENKYAIVNLRYQTLTCFEGDQEVFFTKTTTGGYNREKGEWGTPLGTHTIWRKLVSLHMSVDNIATSFDVSGVAWTTLFDNNIGAAVHSTYWHNYYGIARSNGCVNVTPDDAKWFWRWTEPEVAYFPGEWTTQREKRSTLVTVVES